MTEVKPSLRERKRRRTRREIAEAALRLFAERGYDGTTIADIAAAAEISPRTFFGYFPSKDDVVFADTDERIDILRTTLAGLPPGTSATQALRRWFEEVFAAPRGGLFGPERGVRANLIQQRPELRGKALQRVLTAQGAFAGWLRDTHPWLDPTEAVTVGGALVGGLVAAGMASLERGDTSEQTRAALQRALLLLERGFAPLDPPPRHPD